MSKTIYPKLRGKIIEVYGSQKAFAEALGTTSATLANKLNGKTEFKRDEIIMSRQLLNIEDVTPYFFEN